MFSTKLLTMSNFSVDSYKGNGEVNFAGGEQQLQKTIYRKGDQI